MNAWKASFSVLCLETAKHVTEISFAFRLFVERLQYIESPSGITPFPQIGANWSQYKKTGDLAHQMQMLPKFLRGSWACWLVG